MKYYSVYKIIRKCLGFKNCYHKLLKNVVTQGELFILILGWDTFSYLVNTGIISLAKITFKEVAIFHVCGHIDR